MWLLPYPKRQLRLSWDQTTSISCNISSLWGEWETKTKKGRAWLCGLANNRASGLRGYLGFWSQVKNLLMHFWIGKSLKKVPNSWGIAQQGSESHSPHFHLGAETQEKWALVCGKKKKTNLSFFLSNPIFPQNSFSVSCTCFTFYLILQSFTFFLLRK